MILSQLELLINVKLLYYGISKLDYHYIMLSVCIDNFFASWLTCLFGWQSSRLFLFLVWMDNRTESTINSLLESKKNKNVNQFQELTGLPINPYFSASKYKWLIDNVPSVKTAIEEKRCLFGTVDTWLIWVSI